MRDRTEDVYRLRGGTSIRKSGVTIGKIGGEKSKIFRVKDFRMKSEGVKKGMGGNIVEGSVEV